MLITYQFGYILTFGGFDVEQSKEVVKYNNYMNSLSFGSLGQSELDLFMTICAKMNDMGTEEVEFTFGEIRELSCVKNCDSRERFVSAISSLNRKLINISGHMEDEDEEVFFTLFNELRTLKKEGILKVSVNPKYAFVLNELNNNFTKFELQEFVSLKSKYSKNLYRLLKQFDNNQSSWRTFKTEDLREKLGSPVSYPNKRFIAEILNPSIEELKTIFMDLRTEYTYARRRGKPITDITFKWRQAVDDELPGQVSFKTLEEFDDIVEGMSKEEKRKTIKVANDIVKGKKKAKKESPTSYNGMSFEDIEKQLKV